MAYVGMLYIDRYNAWVLYSVGIAYMREASALLVQPVRAMRRPQQVERAISMGSHALFL